MQASTFAPSPFSARASAIRSRTCGRQRLAFLAVSATGGARKPNPSEGAEGAAAPRTDLAQCEKYHNRHSVDAMPCRGIQPFRQALLILKGLPPPLTQGRREHPPQLWRKPCTGEPRFVPQMLSAKLRRTRRCAPPSPKHKIESEKTRENRRKQAKTRGFNFYIKFLSKNC